MMHLLGLGSDRDRSSERGGASLPPATAFRRVPEPSATDPIETYLGHLST